MRVHRCIRVVRYPIRILLERETREACAHTQSLVQMMTFFYHLLERLVVLDEDLPAGGAHEPLWGVLATARVLAHLCARDEEELVGFRRVKEIHLLCWRVVPNENKQTNNVSLMTRQSVSQSVSVCR
jgi:hypothetical protein